MTLLEMCVCVCVSEMGEGKKEGENVNSLGKWAPLGIVKGRHSEYNVFVGVSGL